MTKRMSVSIILAAALLAAAMPVAAEQAIFVVRHAERAAPATAAGAPGMMADDPPISPAGEQRAAQLATMLASAGIRHIFVTEYRRTRQTADPLAKQLGLEPSVRSSKDPGATVVDVRAAEGNVLIVGHSNTVPDLLKRLGV